MSRRVTLGSKVKHIVEPEGNQVLTGDKLPEVDPKPGDLPMARVKSG